GENVSGFELSGQTRNFDCDACSVEIPDQTKDELPEPKETHLGSTLSSGGASGISRTTPIVRKSTRQEIKTRRVVREPVMTKRGITDMYKGWEREEVERMGGASSGYCDVYYYAPDETRMRSGPEVQTYCQLQRPPIIYAKSFFNFSKVPPPTETFRTGLESEEEIPEIAADFTTNVDGEAHYVTKKRIRAYCLKRLVTKLLGVNFVRTKDGIIMHQIGFIQKLANVFNIVKNEIVKVPVTVGTTLVKCKEGESVEDFPYRSLIGSLMFLAFRSRPDILYAVTYLSQFNVLHSGAHVKCLKQYRSA
uniref:MBD domain-containing protein n=1 Tax=Strigamia maritima TaxID=126957 RepID=T1IHU2_STRMM